MKIILYTKFCRFIGRELASRLGIRGFYNPPPKLLKQATKIIRYGYYEEIPSNAPQINPRNAIIRASSKLKGLQILKDAGIKVPEVVIAGHGDAKTFGKAMWLGRKYHHTGGKDIVIDITDNDDSDYYTKYIKPHREWRVHVFDGKVLFAQKKFFESGNPTGIAEIVRSYANGWRFHRLKDINNLPEACKTAAIASVKALGLTFGAVDVISHGRDGEKRMATVLEVNTAPGLDTEDNFNSYVQAFGKFLKG